MSQEKLDHVVAGAIFDFMGWLTTRQEKLVLSSADDAAPAAEAVKEFLTMRGVAQDCEPMIHDWPARCSMVNIETLISVLCDPEGKCCISGSDDDRRLIDSALAELAQAAQAEGWTKLPGQLPEPGMPVLLDIGKEYPIRAMWAAKHTVQAAEDDTDWGEYVEEDDMYYAPEGWYEWNQCEDNHWRVTETPRAWFPSLPRVCSLGNVGLVSILQSALISAGKNRTVGFPMVLMVVC